MPAANSIEEAIIALRQRFAGEEQPNEVDLNRAQLLAPPLTPNGEWIKLDQAHPATVEIYRSRAKKDDWDSVTIEAMHVDQTTTPADRVLNLIFPAVKATDGSATTISAQILIRARAGPLVVLDRCLVGAGQAILAAPFTVSDDVDQIAVRVQASGYEKASWLKD